MHLSKRGLSNANRLVLDQNEHLNVRSARIRGDLHVMGRIINSNLGPAETREIIEIREVTEEKHLHEHQHHHTTMVEEPTIVEVAAPSAFFCELTMNEHSVINDNEVFVWDTIVSDEHKIFDEKSTITIPNSGLYQINIRIYDFGDGLGSGVSLWVNDEYTYAYVSNSDNDGTNALYVTKPFNEGDSLQVRSILVTTVRAEYPQCYTFQVVRIG